MHSIFISNLFLAPQLKYEYFLNFNLRFIKDQLKMIEVYIITGVEIILQSRCGSVADKSFVKIELEIYCIQGAKFVGPNIDILRIYSDIGIFGDMRRKIKLLVKNSKFKVV